MCRQLPDHGDVIAGDDLDYDMLPRLEAGLAAASAQRFPAEAADRQRVAVGPLARTISPMPIRPSPPGLCSTNTVPRPA
jgi:hypothetical protein